MKICIAFIALALVARCETYTLTNGVPVSGTVVSSIVAQVVIKTPLGQLRQIPVAAFSKTDRPRLPQDAAGIYVAYATCREFADLMVSNSTSLLATVEKGADLSTKEDVASRALINTLLSDSKERDRYLLERNAWKYACELTNSTPLERRVVFLKLMSETENDQR